MKFNPAALTKARENAGLTMEALAKKAKVSVSTISYLENGKTERPRSDVVLRIAEALGADWSLFFASEIRKSESAPSTPVPESV